MLEEQRQSLLKDEYLHLQKTVEEFDGRALTIKAWSVTFSLATIVGAFASTHADIFLLASFSSLLFWVIEGQWKKFQVSYYNRIDEIENFFRQDVPPAMPPFQITSSFRTSYAGGGLHHVLKLMFWYHVALTHVVIFLLGILFFILASTHVITLTPA